MAESEGADLSVVDIGDDDQLYRRLHPVHFNPDGTVNSNAFKQGGKPRSSTPKYLRISVDLAKLTTAADAVGRAPKTGFGLGVLLAREPRARPLSLSVAHDPQKDNPAHSLIKGAYIRETCRRLADATHVVIPATAS